MPNPLLEQQQEFISTFKQTITSLLASNSEDTADLRLELIQEELQELQIAFRELHGFYRDSRIVNDPTVIEKILLSNIFKEYGDLVYVVLGLGIAFKLPVEEILEEIHRSNMSKVHPNGEIKYRDDGKVLKPDGYSPANLSETLKRYYDQQK